MSSNRLLPLFWLLPIALLSLFTLEVALSMRLLERSLELTFCYGHFLDYGALLLLDSQIAALIWLPALLCTFGLSRWLGESRAVTLGVALTSSALCALVLLGQARNAWGIGSRDYTHLLLLSAAPGLGVFLLLGFLSRLRPEAPFTPGRLLVYTLFPAWGAGFASAGLTSLLSGRTLEALQRLLLVGLVGALASFSRRRPARGNVLAMIPSVMVICLIVLQSLATDAYGTPGSLGTPSTVQASGSTSSSRSGASPARADAPNLVLLVLDTVRADHLSLYGYTRQTMPALERFAEQSVVFDRAVSAAGWTTPSHASMLTGLTVSQHGIHHGSARGGGGDAYATPPKEGVRWLTDELAEVGYTSIGVSANPVALPKEFPGFSTRLTPWRVGWYSDTLAATLERVLPLERLSEAMRWRLPYVEASELFRIATRAVEDTTSPLFLLVNVLDAHSPYDPPERALEALHASPPRAFGRYQPHNALTLQWKHLPQAKESSLIDLYDGELRGIDFALETFLPWLEARLGPNTLIVVTSDHGEELGEEGEVGHERGLPQRILHVPLIVKAPSLPPGRVDAPVTLRRLHDFLLEAARRGPDLSVLTQSDPLALVAERYPFQENIRNLGRSHDRFWIAMFDGDLKAIGPSSEGFQLMSVEQSKGFEETVLTDQSSGSSLRARIDAYFETERDRRSLSEGEGSLKTQEMLKELGYLKK